MCGFDKADRVLYEYNINNRLLIDQSINDLLLIIDY